MYSENVRLVASIDSPVFGEVMNVCVDLLPFSFFPSHAVLIPPSPCSWVGAMMVAGITMHKFEGDEVKRGDDVRPRSYLSFSPFGF